MEHGELMTEGFEVGLNCAAAVAILACRKNIKPRTSYRCRSTGILAAPEQQQVALAGARNRSTTCSEATLTEILSVQPTPKNADCDSPAPQNYAKTQI